MKPSVKIRILLVLFILGALPLSLFLLSQRQDIRNRAAEFVSPSSPRLTQDLIQKSKDYKKTPAILKSFRLNELKNTARARKEKLKKELKTNPQRVLEQVLPENVREELPQELHDENLIEKEIEVTGTLTQTHFDDFSAKTATTELNIHADQEYYTVFFATGSAPPNAIGTEVEATGIAIDTTLLLASPDNLGIFDTEIPFQVRSVQGSVKIAAIFFKFSNDTREMFNQEYIKQSIIGSGNTVADYYSENSFDTIQVSADTFGYYTINAGKPTTECYSHNIWADQADQKVREAGIDLTSYNYRFYFFPMDTIYPCYGAAWANYPYIGNPYVRAWFTPYAYDAFTLTHELGHNLGLAHANLILCPNGPIGSFTNNLAECQRYEYGDNLDVMGSMSNRDLKHFSATHKASIGWFDRSQIQQVTQSGTYTLSNLETEAAGAKVLAISIPGSNDLYNSEVYYIDYRQPVGFDAGLPATGTSGALVYLGNPRQPTNATYLLDMHTGWPEGSNNASADAAMRDGEQFIDAENGITITQLAHTPESVTLDIDLTETNVCVRKSASVTVSPQSQNGTIGETKNYQVTIRNTDTTACPLTQFTIQSYTTYSGWTMTFAEPTFTLHPGESATQTVTVTPVNSNAGSGQYLFSVNVSGQAANQTSTAVLFYQLTGSALTVRIHPGAITSSVHGPDTHLSALAYNQQGQPIWEGVFYEWGMSSSNSVGTLVGPLWLGQNIASFRPLRTGVGQLYVNARYGTDSAIVTIPVTVNGTTTSPTPLPSVVPTPSPTFTMQDMLRVISYYGTHEIGDDHLVHDELYNMMDAVFVLRWLHY